MRPPSQPIPRPIPHHVWPHIPLDIPRPDFLERIIHDPPLQNFALTCGALRIVMLANGWHVLLEQQRDGEYVSRAESASIDALHIWLKARYPDAALYGLWQWQPWPYWRNNHLPTGATSPIV